MSSSLHLSIVNFKKGAYIIVEGKQQAEYFYIIRQGKITISKEVEVVEEEGGNVLAPGDFFGVVSTMSSHSHIETAQALTDVALISVHKDNYGTLIKNNAPVAMKIIQGFSKKMRYLDEALTRINFKNSAEPDENHLFNVAEYYAKQSQYNQAYYAYYQYTKYCPDGMQLDTAKERMAKIQPYASAVYLEPGEKEFTRSYPKDTMLFSEGQPGKELFIIQKGSIKITKIVDDNEVLLAVLKTGDIFGEMAILEDKPRSASAIAYEDSVVLTVNKENFGDFIKAQPQIITRLTQLLAERIWFIYKQLANTLIHHPLGRLFDAMLIQLEKNRVEINSNEAYTFDFGPKELVKMAGLSPGEGKTAAADLFKNKKFRIVDNKIHCSDTEEIEKQAKYYRKMEKIERSRREGAQKY
ncbi:MAG: cyclic nucleotide-binding domain-containing protein [Spirochaetales bacterium]|nr:cyclic nucleotide-binding domain-containing protein [Spirochaetales bacterium]MCF7937189.1 cyclic nucleotide-binding domain-containing protein [Spirochaetales bacterium]